MMVEPERLAPGMSARHCANPTARASPRLSRSIPRSRRPTFSAAASSSATTTIIVAITQRFLVNVPSICFLKRRPRRPMGSEPMKISQPSLASADRRLPRMPRPSAQQEQVVAHEGQADVPDVFGEVDEDGDERPQLYDGDRRRHLLGAERLREPGEARGEDEVRRRADG